LTGIETVASVQDRQSGRQLRLPGSRGKVQPPNGGLTALGASAFAGRLSGHVGTAEPFRVGELASHYEGARDPVASLAASLRAAELARQLKALPEEVVHLRRAARLWPTVHAADAEPPDGELDLLERLAFVSEMVGDGEDRLAAWSRSLQLVDECRDPLRASRIDRETAIAEWWTGRLAGQPFEAFEHAVRLSEPFPDSVEYAIALAELSESHSWTDSLEAARLYAEKAIRAARGSGSPEALSRAYSALASAWSWGDESTDAYSAEALRYAWLTGHLGRVMYAEFARSGYLIAQGRLADIVQTGADGLREGLEQGATSFAAFHASTRSPSATNRSATIRPIPLAPSTAHTRSGHCLANRIKPR
jgi:hypothetical protein